MSEEEGTILNFIGAPSGDPNAPPYREGIPSTHEFGVAYFGPWEQRADGFNEHTRRGALALATTGCPVHLRSIGRAIIGGKPKALPKDIGHILTTSVSTYSARIYQLILNANTAQNLVSHREATRWDVSRDELSNLNRGKIIYSVWERDRISKEFAAAISRVGQVWTACNANKEMLIRSGVPEQQVRLVPLPHSSSDPLLKLRKGARRPGAPRFYHIGKWEPRKGQDKMLEAFLLAFKPGEAHLYLRSNSLIQRVEGWTKGPGEQLAKLLERPDVKKNGWGHQEIRRHIKCIENRLTDDEIRSLHDYGDVYLSMSHGEGWDMPAYDAKLAGNMMVYTPSGGPQDFASDSDIRIEKSCSIQCHPFYGWESDAEYIDFDIDAAVAALRQAATIIRRGRSSTIGRVDEFTFENVGKQMLSHLEDLLGGPAYR